MTTNYCKDHVCMMTKQAKIEERQVSIENMTKEISRNIEQIMQANQRLSLLLERHTALLEQSNQQCKLYGKRIYALEQKMAEGVPETKKIMILATGAAGLMAGLIEIIKKLVALIRI